MSRIRRKPEKSKNVKKTEGKNSKTGAYTRPKAGGL